MLLSALEFTVALQKEYVTIRHNPPEKFIWNEWRHTIPSPQLREAMLFACEYILAHDVELILADFSKMHAPSLEDQVWIANRSAQLLQHSKLRRVANILSLDVFEQIAIENIYALASNLPMPCETREFVSKEEAMEWLFSD
ncbi:hypothetical protein GCM10023188_40220 [Pontibacter saemangeumensis]|uniref:SpoIIAA-like n=1 Tax=Pontibacter saemangeumensis TaxID=1084525 RepID=A0ABP8M1X3_9BACT